MNEIVIVHGPPVPPINLCGDFWRPIFSVTSIMSKIRIRMLDDYNLPPEIDISTQRWHVLMRQNHDSSHNNSSHMPICSTLMDNISSQITIFFYNIKWHGMLVLNVLTCHYIPRKNVLWGGGGDIMVLSSLRRYANTWSIARKSLLEYFHMLHVYLYRREDSLDERWGQSYFWKSTQPPPPSPSQNCIFLELWSRYENWPLIYFLVIYA